MLEEEIPGLGNQRALAKAIDVTRKSEMSYRTPLYLDASDLWGDMLQEGLDKNQDSKAILLQIEETIEKAVADKKTTILKSMGK